MPETFGRYELHQLLGRGGMGEVYRAVDTVRDREVALKLLPRHLAADDSFKTRFRRESRMAAKLSDPHIIPIHDFGEIDGQLFIDMRLVKGHDLSSVLQSRGRLSADTAVGLVTQVASALDAAHDSGLVHRDVKPSNILLTGMSDDDANPFAYLVDFGIARAQAQEGTALTSTTATLGTVAYLSPERIAGNPGDRRTDVYALACVLFEMLAGRKPYDGEMFAIMYGHVNAAIPHVTETAPDCPAGLDAVVTRGMAKDPEHRYPTAGALARDARAALRSAAVPLAPPPTPPTVPPGPHTPGGPGGSPTGGTFPRGTFPSDPVPRAAAPPAQNRPPTPPPPLPPPLPPPQNRPPAAAPPPRRAPGNRRKSIIAAAAAVLVAIAGVVAVIAFTGSDGGGTAKPTGSDTSPDFPRKGGTGAPASTLHVGTGSDVTWSDFSSFSTLLGTADDDSTHAFMGATCSLGPGDGDDAKYGVVDRVRCEIGQTVAVQVSRFSTAAKAQSYLRGFLVTGASYAAGPWTQGKRTVGLAYSAPDTASRADLRTTICAMPTYVVSFYATEGSDVGQLPLRSRYWDRAAFPDLVPPSCNPDFTGAVDGETASPGIAAVKPSGPFPVGSLPGFLSQGDPSTAVKTVATAKGSDSIMYDQRGNASFWTFASASNTVTRVGTSKYPYSKSVGAPAAIVNDAVVLTNMKHPTFLLTGNFTADGSGNSVAFALSDSGWGVIKAERNGNLKPSGTAVGSDKIGLSAGFGFSSGRLVTYDCSSQLPISKCSGNNRVIKYWRFNGTEFLQVGSAGRSR